MDADRAIAIIETLLAPKSLNPVQIQIIRGVIAGESYQAITAATKTDALPRLDVESDVDVGSDVAEISSECKREGGYQIGYIRETGAQLWQILTQKLGQKVTKNSLAAVLLWYTQQSEFKLEQSEDVTSSMLVPLRHKRGSATAFAKRLIGRSSRSRSILSAKRVPQQSSYFASVREAFAEAKAVPDGRLSPTPTSTRRSANDNRQERERMLATIELTERFYGRTEEIATLTNWCLSDRCRLILAIGMGGMGKTTLVKEIISQLEGYFQRNIWRSLVNLPPVTELCADLIGCLSPQPLLDLPELLDAQIELLIAALKHERCTIVLDNVESILAEQVQCGQYLPGYEGYDRLFRALGELPHQSCVLLTSREKPHTIARLQIVNPKLVRSITIDGIAATAGHELIQSFGCSPLPEQIWQEVHAHYGGNPLALKIAAITAVELTGGGEKVLELYPLMKEGKLRFRNIDDVLERQFDRLSELEQQLLYWLAIEREPVTGAQLRSNLVLNNPALGDVIDAMQSLSRRCIITCQNRHWSIQPVMMAYVTSRSIELFVAELSADLPLVLSDLQQQFYHLNTCAIVQAQAQDYLRQTQTQYILRPILDRLLATFPDRERLNRHFQAILTAWKILAPIPAGYLAENILNLAIELDSHLS